MKDIIKYLGIIFILFGVALLGIHFFANLASNIILGAAGFIMIVGLITQILITKRKD